MTVIETLKTMGYDLVIEGDKNDKTNSLPCAPTEWHGKPKAK